MLLRAGIIASAASLAFVSVAANATAFTETSPTGGALPTGVTKVGGLVVDLTGSNGTRVVSQLAASQMYRGFANSSENPVAGVATGNPLLFGTQNGFTAALINALGGGLQTASFRITLFDGDTASGNFDFNDNLFRVNGIDVGNWSSILTQRTNNTGTTAIGANSNGFADDELRTGFFTLSDTTKLGNLFTSLSGGSMAFTLFDSDPNDNFYDFTQGVDGGLINVGTGPVITPPGSAVPEPSTWAMMIGGFGMVGGTMRYRRRKTTVSFA